MMSTKEGCIRINANSRILMLLCIKALVNLIKDLLKALPDAIRDGYQSRDPFLSFAEG